MPLISIVIPVFNEEANVRLAYETLLDVWKPLAPKYDIEFVFTDNHSTDATFERLTELAAADPRVKVIRFNRNYGFQRSLLTAYRYAAGDAAIQIDCDLQDPPELIPKMIALWEQGHDVVVGLRSRRVEPRLLTMGRRAFYTFMNYTSEDKFTPDAGDFRVVDRKVLDRMRTVNDLRPYVRGLVSSLAVNEIGFQFDRRARQHGHSKFPLRRLVGFALEGIIGYSVLPLRLATYIGLIISVGALGLSSFYLFAALLFGRSWPSGFATTTVLLLFGISLNAIFLGILGEYIQRIYQQLRNRPVTVVEQALNVPDPDRKP